MLLFLYFLSFCLVRILSSFLFHSSSFFYFFAVFIPFVLQMSSHVLHLHVTIFSFIPTGLLKILREERQDHPNHRQNSRPFSLCCCISIGIELDNFILYFSPPPETLSDHLTGHPSPSLMRVCDSHISSQVSMHISPTEAGQIHHHHHYRRRLQSTALLSRHRHHHPHQQDNTSMQQVSVICPALGPCLYS